MMSVAASVVCLSIVIVWIVKSPETIVHQVGTKLHHKLSLACTCSVGQMQSRLSSALYFEMGELTNAKPSGGGPNVPSTMGIQVAFYLL